MRKQSFIGGSVLLLASAVIVKVIGALFKLPLTALLGGNGMSCFSCAYGIFMPLFAVFSTGLTAAVCRATAERVGRGDLAGAVRLRKAAMLRFSLASLIAGVALLVFSRPLTSAAANPDAALAAAAIAPAMLFCGITSVYRGWFEGMGNMRPTAVSQVVEALVKLPAGLILCRLGLALSDRFPMLPPYAVGAAGAIGGITLSTAVGAVSAAAFPKRLPDVGRCRESDSALMKQLIAIALPVAAGSLVTNLSSLIDLATIIRALPDAESASFLFGSYSALAITIFTLVPSVTNMLGKTVLSEVSSAHAGGDMKRVERSVGGALRLTAFIALPSAAGILALAPEILAFLYPSSPLEAEAACGSLRLLSPAIALLCLSYPVFSALQGLGRAELPVKILLGAASVKLIGNLLFIPRMGIGGAALATLACYLLIMVAALYSLKSSGISLKELLSWLRLLPAAMLCGAMARFLLEPFSAHFSARSALLLAIGAAASCYFLVIKLTRTAYR